MKSNIKLITLLFSLLIIVKNPLKTMEDKNISAIIELLQLKERKPLTNEFAYLIVSTNPKTLKFEELNEMQKDSFVDYLENIYRYASQQNLNPSDAIIDALKNLNMEFLIEAHKYYEVLYEDKVKISNTISLDFDSSEYMEIRDFIETLDESVMRIIKEALNKAIILLEKTNQGIFVELLLTLACMKLHE